MIRDPNIRSIIRALRVLQIINHHRALTITKIAKLSELPYPTAFRIVETMVDFGVIEREATRKVYRPTRLVNTLSAGYRE